MTQDGRRGGKTVRGSCSEAESLYAEAERLRTAGRRTIAEGGLALVCAVDEQEASATYRRAAELFAAVGQGEEAANGYYKAASVWTLGDAEDRYELLLEARELYVAAGRKDGEADCESAIGALITHDYHEQILPADSSRVVFQSCHPHWVEDAVGYLDRARRLYADLGREDRAADCLHDSACFLHFQPRDERATLRYREACELFMSQGRILDAADCLGSLASAMRDLRDPDKAFEVDAQRVQLLEEHGMLQEAADSCRSLTDRLREAGRDEQALVTLERSLALCRSAAERAWQVYISGGQTVVARQMLIRLGYEQAKRDGDLPEELGQAAHRVLGELDAAMLYLECAEVHKRLGRDADARACLRWLERIADDVYSAACAAAREGRVEQAESGFAEAAWLYDEVGRSDRWEDCIQASMLAEGSIEFFEPEWVDDITIGELDQMRVLVLSEKPGGSPEAKPLFLKQGLRRASRTRSLYGMMQRLFGDPEGALRLLTLASDGFSETGEEAEAARCQVEAARARASLGQWDQARELLEAAKLAFVRLGAPEHEVAMCSRLLDVWGRYVEPAGREQHGSEASQ